MPTAAENYAMLEDALSRNFVNPLNTYSAQNTQLGIARYQDSVAQARKLEEIAAARNFAAQQQQANIDSQLELQKRAEAAQIARDHAQFTASKDQRNYETVVRQADAARQDPLMAGFNPLASPEDTVAEYYKRQDPKFADPYYATQVQKSQAVVDDALNRLNNASQLASPAAKTMAIKNTLLDPTVGPSLIKFGVNADDLNKAIVSGDQTLYNQIIDSVRKKAVGFFGGQDKANQFILDVNTSYLRNLGTVTEAGKNNPQFVADLMQVQAGQKAKNDYLTRISDPTVIKNTGKSANLAPVVGVTPPPPIDPAKNITPGLTDVRKADNAFLDPMVFNPLAQAYTPSTPPVIRQAPVVPWADTLIPGGTIPIGF